MPDTVQTPALRMTSTGMTVSISSAPFDKMTNARLPAIFWNIFVNDAGARAVLRPLTERPLSLVRALEHESTKVRQL